MNQKCLKEIVFALFQAALIASVTVFAVFPFSCKVSTEGIQLVGGDYATPEIEEITVCSETSLEVKFSEKVSVTGAVVYLSSDVEDKIAVSTEASDDETKVTFNFSSPTQIGAAYELYAVVEDSAGNSLTFTAEFTGYNASVPKLIMTEVQAQYKKSNLKDGTEYRNEYVEFLALTDGNLAGLRLMSAYDGESKAYDFPAINVQKGEIFVLHMRTAGDGCISEEGDDYSLATAKFSSSVRDLWNESTAAAFGDKADAIVLINKASGAVLDGVLYASPDDTEFSSKVASGAEMLVEAGIYSSSDISQASSSSGLSPIKSLNRIEASAIYTKVQNGEEVEYPVKVGPDSWTVEEYSAGQL